MSKGDKVLSDICSLFGLVNLNNAEGTIKGIITFSGCFFCQEQNRALLW